MDPKNDLPDPLPAQLRERPSRHYQNILVKGKGRNLFLESSGEERPDLSDGAIRERMEYTKSQLDGIIKNYLGDQPKLYEIAEKIAREGDPLLRLVRDRDEEALKNKENAFMLEAIVRTDGSRPCFFVRNNTIDFASSPAGDWEGQMVSSLAENLDRVFHRVGRIDDPYQDQGFAGTGFLVHKNFLLTNRHVLQGITQKDAAGKLSIRSNVSVDFGHEFRATDSLHRRALRQVVFAATKEISDTGPMDHQVFDIALIELEPASAEEEPLGDFFWDLAPDWADPGQVIYTIGYPGRPRGGREATSLLELLFQTTYGYKRIAPGQVMNRSSEPSWTFSHDATTLGGNSGSLVVVAGREKSAAGIHYGGRSTQHRVNWGHILGAGNILAAKDAASPATLQEILDRYGIPFTNRNLT